MEPVLGAPHGPATEEDLAQTVRAVEALDRRMIASKADVRDFEGLKAAVDEGVAQLGKQDVSEEIWSDMIDVNLSGVWRTCKAAIPHLKANGGGSIIITSSDAGLFALPNIAHYVSANHGVAGLMRTLALEWHPT